MTTPQPYIVQPDGWHVKKKNPNLLPGQYHDYHAFEVNNPPLPLTAWHQPGREVSIAIQHQYEPQDEDYFDWRNCSEGRYNTIVRNNAEKYSIDITPVRIAYKVVEVISNVGVEKPVDNEYDRMPQGCKDAGKCIYTACSCKTNSDIFFEPVDEAKPELSVEQAIRKDTSDFWNFAYADAGLSTSDPEFDNINQNIIDTIFEFAWNKGHTHTIQSKELVKMSDVEKLIEQKIESNKQAYNKYGLRELLAIANDMSVLLKQLRTLNK